ncbi:Piezo-type mechanosensitive ion channel component [Aphelenchoides besseyi]|nr:Piezo-type mechanosensitive ion channel component [Aphelenchoides besseyi]
MSSIHFKRAFYRVVLPFSLFVAAFVRPSALGLLYIFLALIGYALPPIPTVRASGTVKAYLGFVFFVSVIASLAQLGFQIVDHAFEGSEETYKKNCANFGMEYWYIQLGFIRLSSVTAGQSLLRLVTPELLTLVSSFFTMLLCNTGTTRNSNSSSRNNLTENEQTGDSRVSSRGQNISENSSIMEALRRLSDLLLVFLIIATGIINPSILNLMYFICGMTVVTWWALYTPLHRASFNQIKVALILYVSLHLMLLYSYQMIAFQHYFPPTSFTSRLFGLSPLITTDCEHYSSITVGKVNWTEFANFATLITAFYVLIFQYDWTKHGVRGLPLNHDNDSSVHEEDRANSKSRNEMEMHSLDPDRPEASELNQGPVQNRTLLLNDNDGPSNDFAVRRLTSQVIDRNKISFIFKGANTNNPSIISDTMQQLCYFILYHCYVFALLAMMCWAMLYHSVFGLFFLLTPCILWALLDSRRWTFKLSSVLVIYAEFLLLVQYVYSLNLTIDELPNQNYMKIIGFVRAETRTAAFVTLAVKVSLSLPLFALLRLQLREKYYDTLTGHDIRRTYGTFESNEERGTTEPIHAPQMHKTSFDSLSKALSTSWVFVVGAVLLLNSMTEPPVLYALGYFLLWTTFICTLVVSFPLFRRTIFIVLTVLIIYSSVVLIALYCYQFPSIPEYWKNFTHLSDEWNADIGLVNFKYDGVDTSLFARLSKPILLLVVTMVQLKFFHRQWTEIVKTPSMRSRSSTLNHRQQSEGGEPALRQLKAICRGIYEVLWRIAEIHLFRLTLYVIMDLTTSHYCAMNFLVVILVVVALCFPACNRVISLVICGYLSTLFICRRIFVMHFIKHLPPISPPECNFTMLNTTRSETLLEWIGFKDDVTLSGDLSGLIVALTLVALQYAVQYRQRHRRLRLGLPEPPEGIVFVEAIDARLFDKNLLMGFKVWCNYSFYKFGLEFSMIAMVYVAWLRMDFLAAVLISWVLIFSLTRRSVCRILWPFLLIYLAIELPTQYAMVLGLPLQLCIQYPWSNLLGDIAKDDNLISFLDLANYRADRHHYDSILLADFLLLMAVAAQYVAFKAESNDHPAGHNNSIYTTGDFTLRRNNPHYDFVADQRSFVDYLKIVVFSYGHWVTMIMVLTAGLGGTSLFALGYLVLAFWMLWQGNNLYTMRNYKRTLSRWYIVCAYTVCAMLWKVSLQIIGCVFAKDMDSWNGDTGCVIRQLFSIVCVNDALEKRLYGAEKDTCDVEIRETKIGLDLIAFAFIVFQMRILHSYLFQHCIIDVRCEIIQASRGAILINQLVEKQMLEQNEQQKKKFSEIKERMESIRNEHGQGDRGPETYAQEYPLNDPRRFSYLHEDDPFPSYDARRSNSFKCPPQYIYHHAKRAGDYYMFKYGPHTEDISIPQESYVTEVLPGGSGYDRLDPAQLIHTAMSKDMDLLGTLAAVETAEKIKDDEQRMIEAVRQKRDAVDTKSLPPISSVVSLKENDDEPSTHSEDFTIEPRNDEELVEIQDKPQETEARSLCFNIMRFTLKMITSALHYASAFFNHHSREHRYVAYVLDKEKIRLKHVMADTLYNTEHTTDKLRSEWTARGMQMVSSAEDIGRVEEEAQARWEQRHVLAKFIISYVSFVTAYTHIVCFICACIAHAYCGGLVTLPLPLMVFLWGSLCNPRPPKVFWVAMITYTELVIIIKFIFQFGFYQWNKTETIVSNSASVFKAQYVFGVQRTEYFAIWDVCLLIALFLHRYMLRRIGLWKDANIADTFVNVNVVEHGPSTDAEEVEDQGESPKSSEHKQLTEKPTDVRRTGFSLFYHNLRHPKFRYIRDLYPIMFFLDIFCMFILVIKYSQFGELSSTSSVLLSSRIPLMFVIMLFILIIMLVIDRALYLRKSVFWKLLYQFATILVLHIWIFGALPAITKTEAADNKAAAWFYVVKCMYLIVSAWQIRNGYPKLCTGNLLTHSYGLVNYILFYVFMFLPLVFELRTIIDWTWTETTMPIFDFIKMEVFYSKIYLVKCARVMEQNFPAPRGVPRGKIIKYLYGLPAILAVVLLVLSPLLAFSLLNRIGAPSKPQRVDLTIALEGYPPIYAMSAQGLDLEDATQSDVASLTKWFSTPAGQSKKDQDRARMAISFISDYATSDKPDLMKIKFRPESDVFWPISSESLDAMQQELQKSSMVNKTLLLRIHLEFVRGRNEESKEPVIHSADWLVDIKPNSTLSKSLQEAIRSPGSHFNVEHILPYYVVVPNEGKVQEADILHKTLFASNETYNRTATYSTANFVLHEVNPGNKNLWTMGFRRSPLLANHAFKYEKIDYGVANGTSNYVQMVAFVDRVFPSYITKYTQGGITAMYIAIVYFAARILRSVVTSEPLSVIINEMPNPDYLLKVCMDIYLVREERDFALEEDLFAKLIFLFRSPETLIRWTRYKIKAE